MDATKSVQGVALYAEFARNLATTQIIITPRGFDEGDKEVQPYIVRRTITSDNPRKQWRFSGIAIPSEKDMATCPPDALVREFRADLMMRYATNLYEQIVRGGWVLIAKPILVEASKADLTAVRLMKTPTKLLYRISSSRAPHGYPAEVINAL